MALENPKITKRDPDGCALPGLASAYTEELADRICDLVATHACGYEKISKSYDGLPNRITVYGWLHRHPSFKKKWDEAKERQANLLAESVLDIIDNNENDTYVDDKGNIACIAVTVSRDRLRMDGRKWLASKLLPKIYGDTRDLESVKEVSEQNAAELKEIRAKLDEQNRKDY